MSESSHIIRLIALVGMAGSGKSLVAQYLESLGFFQFRFGGIVEGEVRNRGLIVNEQNERIVREELRAEHGMGAMAKLARPILREALERHVTIIVDGLYSFREYKVLRQEFGQDMVVVCITCNRSIRYARLQNRDVRPLSREMAIQRDVAEIENLEKGGPIAIADYTLLNNTSPADLLINLDNLLKELDVHP